MKRLPDRILTAILAAVLVTTCHAQETWPIIMPAPPAAVYVAPSGDETGKTDRERINAAIATITYPTTSRGHGTVLLSGERYYVDGPIHIGAKNPPTKPVNLVAMTHATIAYTGPQTSDYLVTVTGDAYSPTDRLSGLYLDCRGASRGVRITQTYLAGIGNTTIFNAREIGLDAISCWKADFRRVHIWYTSGLALRIHRCYGAVFDNLRVAKTSTKTWPAEDDQSVIDDTGKPLQLPASQRAAVWMNTRNNVFRSLMFEGNTPGTLPLLYLHFGCRGLAFTEQMYLETNAATAAKIYIAGAGTPDGETSQITFENVNADDLEPAATFVQTTGYVSRVDVDRIRGGNLQTVIEAKSGHLYAPHVDGARLGIRRESQIRSSGGEIHPTEPYTADHSGIE